MAIYMLNVSHVSAADGQSATAKRDYILREGKYAKDASELVQIGHEYMPEFAQDNPRDFWSAADEHERKNARLCSEIRIALPKELSIEQQVDLSKAFINEHLSNQPCSWALHKGKGKNPHCHIIFSERTNQPNVEYSREVYFKRNGAKKNRDFNAKEWVEKIREDWEYSANHHLELAGETARIDRRTLAEQCADHVATVAAELSKEKPDMKVVQKHEAAAIELDRDPQEKKRWLRDEKGVSNLVPFRRMRFKPIRPQIRLLERLKGMMIMWHLADGDPLAYAILAAGRRLIKAITPTHQHAFAGAGMGSFSSYNKPTNTPKKEAKDLYYAVRIDATQHAIDLGLELVKVGIWKLPIEKQKDMQEEDHPSRYFLPTKYKPPEEIPNVDFERVTAPKSKQTPVSKDVGFFQGLKNLSDQRFKEKEATAERKLQKQKTAKGRDNQGLEM